MRDELARIFSGHRANALAKGAKAFIVGRKVGEDANANAITWSRSVPPPPLISHFLFLFKKPFCIVAKRERKRGSEGGRGGRGE